MSIISKIAVIGVASVGALIAVAGMTSGVTAEEVNDNCTGRVTIGDYNAGPADAEIVLNPGDRDLGRIDLNGLGWIRWYCDEGDGLTAHREDCMDGNDAAIVEARLRENGDLRIVCS
jgi:hypothetical protein